MQDIILNQVFHFSFPETFRVMSEEEVAQLNVIGRGEGVCLKSEELHIVISMGWKQEGGFFTKLLVGKDLVAPMESCYRKRMKPFGYMKNEDLQRQVAGETARGLRYSYQVNGTGMTGESFVLTRDNTRYYLHVYYRTQLGNESREVWKSILDSAGWQ